LHNSAYVIVNLSELYKVNDKLITTLDFGTFKKSEDEGMGIRQQVVESIKTLVLGDYNISKFSVVFKNLVDGLEDINEAIGATKEKVGYTFIQKYF